MSTLIHETVPHLYLNSIRVGGGVPVVLPVHGDHASSMIERIDGLVLTGGGDVDPRIYSGDAELARGVDEVRDGFEMDAIRSALERNIPIFAICRGMQVLNVALGGNLVGDLEQTTGSARHWDLEHWDIDSHQVELEAKTQLRHIMGPLASVNSMHHQAVDQLGDGLRVSARSSDGVVEGVEMEGQRFVLGVQWHPECLLAKTAHAHLFRAFIEAVAK